MDFTLGLLSDVVRFDAQNALSFADISARRSGVHAPPFLCRFRCPDPPLELGRVVDPSTPLERASCEVSRP
jgi:hypothetical protein